MDLFNELEEWREYSSYKPPALCWWSLTVEVMEESKSHQGATILTYSSVLGEEGKYSSCFKVYRKKIDPLGNIIISETTPDKRTTHWCPNIQK